MKKQPPKNKKPGDQFIYPPKEDIYNREKIEDIDPDTGKIKEPIDPEKMEGWNEKDFRREKTGDDLDVPGAELDDQQEEVGSEDEENNYYSLGADKEDGEEPDDED